MQHPAVRASSGSSAPLVAVRMGGSAHWTRRRDAPATKESTMEPMTIGEFARRSRMSPKALHL